MSHICVNCGEAPATIDDDFCEPCFRMLNAIPEEAELDEYGGWEEPFRHDEDDDIEGC